MWNLLREAGWVLAIGSVLTLAVLSGRIAG